MRCGRQGRAKRPQRLPVQAAQTTVEGHSRYSDITAEYPQAVALSTSILEQAQAYPYLELRLVGLMPGTLLQLRTHKQAHRHACVWGVLDVTVRRA